MRCHQPNSFQGGLIEVTTAAGRDALPAHLVRAVASRRTQTDRLRSLRGDREKERPPIATHGRRSLIDGMKASGRERPQAGINPFARRMHGFGRIACCCGVVGGERCGVGYGRWRVAGSGRGGVRACWPPVLARGLLGHTPASVRCCRLLLLSARTGGFSQRLAVRPDRGNTSPTIQTPKTARARFGRPRSHRHRTAWTRSHRSIDD